MAEKVRDRLQDVYSLFESAKKHRVQILPSWDQDYRMVMNRYWRDSGWRSRPAPAVPNIWAIVRDTVAWLTDNPYSTIVTCEAPPDSIDAEICQLLADDLRLVLDNSWIAHRELEEATRAMWFGLVFGTGFLKVVWDQSLAGGLGDATIRAVHPQAIYPDPHCSNDRDWNFVIEARRMSLATLDRMFPGSAAKLKGSVEPLVPVEDPPSLADLSGDGRSAPVYQPLEGSNTDWRYVRSPAGLDIPVTVFEGWFREWEHVPLSEEGPEISRTGVVEDWRVVVWAGDTILMDKPAREVYGHGRPPFVRWIPFDMGEFWGMSLVRLLTPSQIAVNRLLASMHNNVELAGDPPLVYSQNSGLDRQEIYNRPGFRIPVANGSTVQPYWLQPPGWHSGYVELLKYHLAQMQDVAGLSVAARQAAGELDKESVSETAFVSIRQMLRQWESSLSAAGTLKAALVTENYTEPRMMHLFGSSGDVAVKMLQARHFYVPTIDGLSPLEFSILVRAGSDTHTNRRLRANQAVTLGGMGFLDEEEVLKAVQWPNAKQVADRVKAAKLVGALSPPGVRQRTRRAGG